jgi:hypothetical protein
MPGARKRAETSVTVGLSRSHRLSSQRRIAELRRTDQQLFELDIFSARVDGLLNSEAPAVRARRVIV